MDINLLLARFMVLVIRVQAMILYRITYSDFREFDSDWRLSTTALKNELDRFQTDAEQFIKEQTG